MKNGFTRILSLIKSPLRVILLLIILDYVSLLLLRLLFGTLDLFVEICLISIVSIMVGLLISLAVGAPLKHLNQNETGYYYVATFSAFVFFFASAQLTLLNMDRSRSFYVLAWVAEGKISESNNRITYEGIQSPEILNSKAIDQRVAEQVNRGLVTKVSHKFKLTFLGHIVLQVTNFAGTLFSLSNWLLNKY